MRVLLANPAHRTPSENGRERYLFGAGCRFPWSVVKTRSAQPRYSMFPFFLGYTAAVLEELGVEVFALDGVPLNLSAKEFFRRAVAVSPDIILFEPSTPSLSSFHSVARELKNATNGEIDLIGPRDQSAIGRP